ncbi:MAG: hypothetical protein ACFFDN_49990 [Candidatus Hodarchaeota archaeon]
MQVRELVKKVAKELYNSYGQNPHIFVDTKSFFKDFNENVGKEENITEDDLIIALDYLSIRKLVKLEYSTGSNIPTKFRVSPSLIDFVEE